MDKSSSESSDDAINIDKKQEALIVKEESVDLDELYKNDEWYLSSESIEKYQQFFAEADIHGNGWITFPQTNEYFKDSSINKDKLLAIWKLCCHSSDRLEESMFYVMFHIIFKISEDIDNKIQIPIKLPLCLQYNTIQMLKLRIKLKNSKNNQLKLKIFQDIETLKLKIKKEKENKIKKVAIVTTPTPEEIRETKRINLSLKYSDFDNRNWYFNDVLGIKQGAYSINELIICYKNMEINSDTVIWNDNNRHLNNKLHKYIELYEYINSFKQYNWYYKTNNNIINGPFSSSQMNNYLLSGTINDTTQVKKQKKDDDDKDNKYNILIDFDVYKIWKKNVIVSSRKHEGYLIQDTATMFLHNLCYYYFAVNMIYDSNKYADDNTLSYISIISIIISIFESILISLGQFELKEKFIPYDKVLIPIAIIQLIFEFFLNLPMVIVQIYYLYYIKWNNDIYNINTSIYVSFAAYVLYGFYKIIIIYFHHWDQFRDYDVRSQWRCCGYLHVFNWAICLPTVLIVFGAMYFNNDNNDYILSLVLIIIGCVCCCCVSCLGAYGVSLY